MKKAIDNYAVGKQIEVEAVAGLSVPASLKRYYCPECMESVALDIRGFFRHKNRTTESIDCEKRVDIPSRTSYERMGLPFFIKKDIDEYHLYLGFPPLLPSILNKAQVMGSTVTISVGKYKNIKLKISEERFDSEHITKIPMEYLPAINEKYEIIYESAPDSLLKYWTNNTDLWEIGQFFRSGEEFCRKVRALGNLTTNQDYYFVGDDRFFKYYVDCVSVVDCGIFRIGNTVRTVKRIRFFCNSGNENNFKNLSNVILERFHLNLLISDSELMPLWPPCKLDENYFVFPQTVNRAFFWINSSNDEPTVYRYIDKNYVKETMDGDNSHVIKLPVSSLEMPVSVDKVFNGNIQFIRSQRMNQDSFVEEAKIYFDDGTIFNTYGLMSLKKKTIVIKSTCKSTVYHFNSLNSCVAYSIDNEDGVSLNTINWNDVIIVTTRYGKTLLKYQFLRDNSYTKPNDKLIGAIRNAKGPLVQVDRKFILAYQRLGYDNQIKTELERFIRKRYVPVQVLEIIRNILEG